MITDSSNRLIIGWSLLPGASFVWASVSPAIRRKASERNSSKARRREGRSPQSQSEVVPRYPSTGTPERLGTAPSQRVLNFMSFDTVRLPAASRERTRTWYQVRDARPVMAWECEVTRALLSGVWVP